MTNQAIILAGGKGKRMESEIPKVLHTLGGVSFIGRVIKSAEGVSDRPVIVVGYKGQDVINHLENKYEFVWQKEQLGTGHAVLCAKDMLEKMSFSNIVVLPGDHPCINQETVKNLVDSHIKSGAKITIATVAVPNYEGIFSNFYNCGRIIRDEAGDIADIVELKDCGEIQREIKEVNVSYYCFNARWLWENIVGLSDDNKAKEFYLTDLIKIAKEQGQKIGSVAVADPVEGLGVNSKEQLAVLEGLARGSVI